MKTVYIAMSADLVTPSHVKIIQEAGRSGLGLLTDKRDDSQPELTTWGKTWSP